MNQEIEIKHQRASNFLYPSSNTITMMTPRRIRLEGHVACMREKQNAQKVLLRKSEGMRPLQRPRHRWEDSIKRILEKDTS
jgi:hypothetical protein